jgi:MraZ protein
VARFIGRYEHSLDLKGRVILPAKLRSAFDTQAFLTQHLDRCLALWTPEAFDEQAVIMQAKQSIDAERNSVRLWAASSIEVEMDRQGRVAIPQFLRDFAGLEIERPLMITGAIDHIELWNLEEFAARVQSAEHKWTTSSSVAVSPPV